MRTDDLVDLGRPTTDVVIEKVNEGKAADARQLASHIVEESKSLHDLMCDWVWDIFTKIAKTTSEQTMHQIMKSSQQGWMMKRTWKAFLKLSVIERVYFSAEILRSHHGGPRQQGELDISDEGDHYRISMDPCGSGGRMRRGDPVDGTPSRLGAPYDFGVTGEAYDWSWQRKNVPYYCLHCCLNETLPMEWGGHPLWVTDYQDDATKPCAWLFYKKAEDIPEHYYRRVGRVKPASGGQY